MASIGQAATDSGFDPDPATEPTRQSLSCQDFALFSIHFVRVDFVKKSAHFPASLAVVFESNCARLVSRGMQGVALGLPSSSGRKLWPSWLKKPDASAFGSTTNTT